MKRLAVEVAQHRMSEVPADIQKVLERISERIERLEADGQAEGCDRLRRVSALLQRGDFPVLTTEECDLLAEWRGSNRKLACLTEHRRLILDKWLSACRLRLSSGPRKITDEQYAEWSAWLAANWGEPKTPEPAGLPSAKDEVLIEASPSDDFALTRLPARDEQRDVNVSGGHEYAEDDCESKIASRIIAPPEMLEPAIAEMLARIPDVWQTYRPDDLTEVQSQGLFLLTAAGMVRRRERFRLKMAGQPLVVEATLEATGEYGLVEAMEPLAAQLWPDWRDVFRAWMADQTRQANPFHCERLEPSEWRLTDQGILARQDIAAGQSQMVFDFTLRRGFFDGRPRFLPDGIAGREPVRGAGALVRMQKFQDQKVVAVSAGIGDMGTAGGEALSRALCGMFEAMQAYAGKPASAVTGAILPPVPASADRTSKMESLAEKMASAQEALSSGKREWIDLLPERVKYAYGQYLSAVPNVPDQATDRECYDWAKGHNEGSPIPAFETWQRYVRQARKHLGQQKNTPQAGRSFGRSIALPEEIDPPEADEAD